MRIPLGTRLLASLVLAVVAAGAGPGPAHAVLDPAQASCRKRVGKEGRTLVKKTLKALSKCRDKISKGQFPTMTDCTIESSTENSITKATDKVTAKIPTSCPDAVVAQLVFGGDCYGVTTGADLASCLNDTHVEQATELVA